MSSPSTAPFAEPGHNMAAWVVQRAPERVRVVRAESLRALSHEFLPMLFLDTRWVSIREMAYVCATVQWETGGSFKPIKERRAKEGTPVRKLQDRYWKYGFFGRGYIQLTWRKNYRLAGSKLYQAQFPDITSPEALERTPDLLLQPNISYEVLSRGMREGWFTGRKLLHYISDDGLKGEGQTDYVNARRVVNGVDKAKEIASLALGWELLLRGARAFYA